MSVKYKIENAKLNKKLVGDEVTVSKVKPRGPRGPRGPKQPTLREIMLDVQKDVKDLQKWRKTVDAQFKAHGWTK